MLHDMHCHLSLMANAEEVAERAQADGMMLFANTVTPDDWAESRFRFERFDNVILGFGMHPWWVVPLQEEAQGSAQGQIRESARNSTQVPRDVRAIIDQLDENDPLHLGEIGLDFGWRHQHSRSTQVEAFSAILEWASRKEGRLLSLHAIKSARETFELLVQTGAADSCTCVFHWFSGPSDVLKQAVLAGCYFSCGKRMLATGKGKEYVKAIPANRLLLETDAPPELGGAYPYESLRADLENVARSVAEIKGSDALEIISQTSRKLLNGSKVDLARI